MTKNGKADANFPTMKQSDIPSGRKGKHNSIVNKIVSDLERLQVGRAIKVPLRELGDKIENVRAAFNRAIHKHKLDASTSADANFLYVWKNGGDGSNTGEPGRDGRIR